MSDEAAREGSSRRLSSRKLLSETTLPQEYLDRLEEKRKQLDESIHKYIAAKEREYKNFQKELKQQYKLSQGQDGRQDVGRQRGSPNGVREDEQSTQLQAQRVSALDALLLTAERQDAGNSLPESAEDGPRSRNASAIAGLQDRKASVERDKDFLGLFTPDYLPALNAKDAPPLQRTTSAPQTPNKEDGEPITGSCERANSDSLVQAKPKRPYQLALAERTSSSGSSADGRLASALKSPTQRTKQKRVSLAVGDSIVAPSDNVPTTLNHHTTSSHSRKRSSVLEHEYPLPIKRSVPGDEANESMDSASQPKVDTPKQVTAATSKQEQTDLLAPAVRKPSPTSNLRPTSNPSKIDPDGDLFDLQDEDEDLPPSPIDSDDSDNVLEDEDDVLGRIEPAEPPLSIPTGSGEVRYDSSEGLVPEPKERTEDSAVPYLAFGATSAIAPTKPGFRRPSVIDDPVFVGADYKAAEEEAVENEVYGSSYNRPSSKGSFTPGSLGESYMAKHAEEMMKLRVARQHGQVRS